MFPAFWIGLVSAPVASKIVPTERDKICAVGRAALRDLSLLNSAPPSEKFYNGRTDQYHHDILDVCPSLRSELPAGFTLATDAVFTRARNISTDKPVSVFDVEVPKLFANSKRATVKMGYYCNGMCGARFETTYVLTATGWKAQGKPRMTAIS